MKIIDSIGYDTWDFDAWKIDLCESEGGSFYLHCEGGARTCFAKHYRDGSTGYGEQDIPIMDEKVEYLKSVLEDWDSMPEHLRSVKFMILDEIGYKYIS